MLIKICGITRMEDADAAVACGANALGFVFWPKSPRFVDPFRARAIVLALPPFVTTVGVFVNQPAAHVNGVASLVGLGAVQLHGDETPAFAALMRRPVIKAIAMGGGVAGRRAGADPGRPDIAAWSERVTILLDAHDPEQRGGTGQTIDWQQAASVAGSRRVLLAGGLTPENVAEAVRRVQPFGIDVSSGVEAKPGIKDHGRLRELFRVLTEQLPD